MSRAGERDDYPEDSELGGEPPPRIVHNHYSQNRNGNGAANKAVWWVAGIAVVALLSINGVIWSVAMTKLWALSEAVAQMQGQLSTLIDKQQ